MKFHVVAALAVLCRVQAAESVSTTVTCSGCPPHSSMPDMVTRSALPTISCSQKPLTVVSDESGPSSMPSGAAAPTGSMPTSTPSSVVPVSGASRNNMGAMALVLGVAAAAAGSMM